MPSKAKPGKAKPRPISVDPAIAKQLLKRIKTLETRTARMAVTIQNLNTSVTSGMGSHPNPCRRW